MSKTFSQVLMAAVCAAAIFLTLPARAQVNITLVAVGDTNNAADSTVMVTDTTSGYGSVAKKYSISASDITLDQYTAFLNSVGKTDPYGCWNSSMAAGNPNTGGIMRSGSFSEYTYSVIGTGSNPVTYVSWLDAARFCNWLQNGQPATGAESVSTTETGAYSLAGDTSGGLEVSATNAEYFIPTEDEWYKAAYYDPTIGGTGGYWTYPTAANATPGNNYLTPATPDEANYITNGVYSVNQSAVYSSTQVYLTPVGSFTNSASHYGTFDQGGDVYQWNDAIISGTARGVRGGSWQQTSNTLQSSDRESRSPTAIFPDLGFRVATTLPPLPVISSNLSATGTDSIDFTYTITAYNSPTSYGASGLPNGLSLPGSTGVITGTPTQTGTFQVSINASNVAGTGSANLVLVIMAFPMPSISSSLSATGTADLPFSYTIAATANPTTFAATTLPPGLAITASNGLISGTPTQSGTFSSTISAVNSSGTGSAALAIDILAPPVPVISSTLNVTGTNGTAFDYQIEGTFGPTSFTSGTLPTGLSLDGSTGLISGTPTVTGSFSASISAINLGGTGTATLDFDFLAPVPDITSALTATATNGLPFTYTIVAGNSPTSFGATGLPPGLTVSATTGAISGTLNEGGVFPVTLDAVNASGTASAILTITVGTSFSTLAGSYQGLVSLGGTDKGLFTMSVTSAGSFTGKIVLPAVQYSLKGTFSPQGRFAAIQAEGSAILDIFLNVNAALPGISGSVTAATSAAATNYGVECALLGAYTASTIPAGVAGYYTAMIPAISATNPALPDAPGYGVMNVSKTGAIHITGKLGDNTTFNVRSQLDADGKTWTFYTPLYGNSLPGILAGTMTFEGLKGSDCDGALQWIKNAGDAGFYSGGFSATADLNIAKYSSSGLASGTTPGTLVFAGGNLASSSTNALTISDTLKISAAGKATVTQPGTTVTIAPTTGVFSGVFPAQFGGAPIPKWPFGGVFYTKPATTPVGFGLFLGSDETGSVTIKP